MKCLQQSTVLGMFLALASCPCTLAVLAQPQVGERCASLTSMRIENATITGSSQRQTLMMHCGADCTPSFAWVCWTPRVKRHTPALDAKTSQNRGHCLHTKN